MIPTTSPRPVTAAKPATAPAGPMPRMGWLEWVVISQTALPALLFLPGTTALRSATRALAFVLPLAAWAAVESSGRRAAGGRRYPAAPWLLFCSAWLLLEVAHPDANSLKSALAEVALNTAIFCPAFWAPALVRDPRQVRRLIVVMLVCNGASALMGIAQVYRPDTFRPPYVPLLANSDSLEAEVTITTDDGRKFIRPFGLSDTPGAAGMAGLLSCLTGLAVALPPAAAWKRAASVGTALAGLTVIFYSQVRFTIILLVIGLAAWAVMLAARREARKLILLSACAALLSVAATGWVLHSGGAAVMARFLTLMEDRADAVYYKNRGRFVDFALTVMTADYPLGAGLGRTGMMYNYFGDPFAPPSRGYIFCEIQLQVWILDGGVPLLLAASGAVIAALIVAARTALRCPDEELGYWATVVVIFGLFNALSCLGSSPFVSPNGLQFWVLMGALFGADAVAREAGRRAPARPRPPASRAAP